MVELLEAIAVEQVDANIFRGRPRSDTALTRTFGGEVAARALAAGSCGMPVEFGVHSIHGYFVRPAVPGVPIDYTVDTVKHGRSFAVRWIRGVQHGHETFLMVASFHIGDHGVRHADPIPDAPAPEELFPADTGAGYEWQGWDIRRVPDDLVGGGAHQQIWLRYTGILPGDLVTASCALTYASDMTLLGAAMAPYPGIAIQTAALDYSIWFLRPFRVDQWLLYDEVSPSADRGRAFTQGRIFNRDGELVAMVAQERMLRVIPRTEKAGSK
ncbi:thioesterase family protein [Nocardia sp. CDC159]|uniref:Thioesterase family protein n=1 Tax=Nocardia pulmonis TaxID=2951408 RepID=A0A9X2IX89_9NOCA|nr:MULTISPECIES: acyl-CoA thioesterase domain-containing protein [Nocardia]MCM6773590.1 thioesterase family protein [Nocardia pulmonis]MCM6786477.1 thioesterase family protein [Nocardia sp. CDC159]